MDTRLPRVSLRRERDVAAMVTAWTLAPRRPHWRTDRRGRAMTLSFRHCRVLEDIADAVGGAVLADPRQEASNLAEQIKPAAPSTTIPWHVSKPSFHQSDERSRPQLMSRTPRQ